MNRLFQFFFLLLLGRLLYVIIDMKLEQISQYFPQLAARRNNATANLTKTSFQLKIDLPYCPEKSHLIVVKYNVSLTVPTAAELRDISEGMLIGGFYEPTNTCKSNTTVAVIIPIKDQRRHVLILLRNFVPFLKRQEINFQFIVMEQMFQYTLTEIEEHGQKNLINKEKLMNIGFVEALKIYEFECFIFHDVDDIPENDYNLYKCNEDYPVHLMSAREKENYKPLYEDFFGGAIANCNDQRTKQFQQVNGFSNRFLGWGGEDDDMFDRIKYHGFEKVLKIPSQIGRYRSIPHKQEKPAPNRLTNLYNKNYSEGLSTVLSVEREPLFTVINVNL